MEINKIASNTTVNPNYEQYVESLPDVGTQTQTTATQDSGFNWNKFGETASVLAPNLIGAAANVYLANQVDYQRVNPTYVDSNLIDSTMGLNQIGTAFSGANAALQANTQGGQYLTNRLASASVEASKRADYASQIAAQNAGILNQASAQNAQSQQQANVLNAEIQKQELQDRLSGYGSAVQSLQRGATDYLQAVQAQRRTEQLLPFLGGSNFKAMLDAGYNPAEVFGAELYGDKYSEVTKQRAK